MLKILTIIFFTIRCKLEERGYLYSVGRKQFVTYDDKSDSSLVYVSKSEMPRTYRIVEIEGSQAGDVFLELFEFAQPDYVLDSSGRTYELIVYAKHGGTNQRFTLKLVGDGMVKLVVRTYCVTTDPISVFLKEDYCNNFERTKEQYFRWVPYTRKKEVESYIYGKKKGPRSRYEDEDFEEPVNPLSGKQGDGRRDRSSQRSKRSNTPRGPEPGSHAAYKDNAGDCRQKFNVDDKDSCSDIDEDFEMYMKKLSRQTGITF